jgi:hypothetical protein
MKRILGSVLSLLLFVTAAFSQTPAVPIGPGGGTGGGGGLSPGVTLSNFASPTAFAGASIPSGANLIYVRAVSGGYPVTSGISTCGLTYSLGTSVSTGLYGEIYNNAASVYWA